MTSRRGITLLLALAAGTWIAVAVASLPARAAEPATVEAPDLLPDSAALARVQSRVIRVRDFVQSYFNAYPPNRPGQDSLGRVEFLNSMIHKEVLALVAAEVDRPLEFEDRLALRAHTQRLLSNLLYQRTILDSVTVSEEDLQQAYQHYKLELHLQHILLDDRATAEKVRGQLLRNRIAWSTAVRLHSRAVGDPGPDGDLGWIRASRLGPATAARAAALKREELSPILEEPSGYRIVRLADRRLAQVPAFESVRSILRSELHGWKVAERRIRFQEAMLVQIGARFDTANLVWASAQFRPPVEMLPGQIATLQIRMSAPNFAPGDTSRILARWADGTLTLGEFVKTYVEVNPALRTAVTNWLMLRDQVGSTILEPYQAEFARRMGLENDPLLVAQVARKREELMVEHLYQDSVESRVTTTSKERRRYYQEHQGGYITYPKVLFAQFDLPSRAAADSMAARLKAREDAATIVREDSLAGRPRRGRVRERGQHQEGMDYHKELFEELRPGQVAVYGPEEDGRYRVLQLLSFDPGRQLSFEEAEHYVTESLESLAAEQILKEFLERHRRRYRIEAHPELVMRVAMKDPTL